MIAAPSSRSKERDQGEDQYWISQTLGHTSLWIIRLYVLGLISDSPRRGNASCGEHRFGCQILRAKSRAAQWLGEIEDYSDYEDVLLVAIFTMTANRWLIRSQVTN